MYKREGDGGEKGEMAAKSSGSNDRILSALCGYGSTGKQGGYPGGTGEIRAFSKFSRALNKRKGARRMNKLTGAEIVIECLKEQGVDTVFGYPGGTILNIYDALYKPQDEITHILTLSLLHI